MIVRAGLGTSRTGSVRRIWTNGSDLEGRSSGIASLYMVGASLPYTVLIGEDNKIIAKGLLGDDLTRQLNELTKKKKK